MRAFRLSALLLALAVPAAAQPARGTVFATLSGVAVEETAPSAGHGALFTGDRFDGSTHGGVLGVGVHLSPRWTVRAEWHLTGAVFVKETLPPADAVEIALARQFAATAVQFGFPPGPAEDYLVRGGYDYERRDRVGMALAGRRFGDRRVALDVLAGAAYVSKHETATSFQVYASARTGAEAPELRQAWDVTKRQLTGVGGGDLLVRLTPRLHALAGVRGYRIQRGTSVRSTLGLRWRF
jgi:hypothetical protein